MRLIIRPKKGLLVFFGHSNFSTTSNCPIRCSIPISQKWHGAHSSQQPNNKTTKIEVQQQIQQLVSQLNNSLIKTGQQNIQQQGQGWRTDLSHTQVQAQLQNMINQVNMMTVQNQLQQLITQIESLMHNQQSNTLNEQQPQSNRKNKKRNKRRNLNKSNENLDNRLISMEQNNPKLQQQTNIPNSGIKQFGVSKQNSAAPAKIEGNIKQTDGPSKTPLPSIANSVGKYNPDGSWFCTKCDHLNAKSQLNCQSCADGVPTESQRMAIRRVMAGIWQCPSCKSFNGKKNRFCFTCKTAKPKAHEFSLPINAQPEKIERITTSISMNILSNDEKMGDKIQQKKNDQPTIGQIFLGIDNKGQSRNEAKMAG